MTTKVLSFANVGMIFPDGTEALQNVTFDIAPKEFVSIVGPSGCGKSTVLRIASGLLQQTEGEVSVDSNRLGYVFQDATLMEWRTVQGNVELLAELQGFDAKERKQRATEAIELVGLAFVDDVGDLDVAKPR